MNAQLTERIAASETLSPSSSASSSKSQKVHLPDQTRTQVDPMQRPSNVH